MKKYNAKIDINEVLRYLGYQKMPDDSQIIQQIDDASGIIGSLAEPRYIYKVFDLEFCGSNTSDTGFIQLKGTSINLTGMDANKLLAQCHQCIIMAATIGNSIEMALRKAQISNMAKAVILDSCASSAIENICNQINDDLEADYLKKSLYLTDRFSPGYGDMPLELQSGICSLLETEKRIGLSVTSSLLLNPSKSITAILGISAFPQPARIRGCASCRLNKTCNYRKTGTTC